MQIGMKHNFWLAKPYSLANQKLYYIQMLLKIEISCEYDRERSKEWLVNTNPNSEFFFYRMVENIEGKGGKSH